MLCYWLCKTKHSIQVRDAQSFGGDVLHTAASAARIAPCVIIIANSNTKTDSHMRALVRCREKVTR